MKNEVTIYSGEELIQFMITEKLNSKQISQIIFEGFQIIAFEEKTPQALIEEFRDYVMRYENYPWEKPIFLGLDIDIE